MTEKKELPKFVGLIPCVTNEGPCYIYLRISPENWKKLIADFDKGTFATSPFDPDKYGEIIKEGPGKEPPQEVKEEMEREYVLLDHDFEKNFGKHIAPPSNTRKNLGGGGERTL